MNTVVNMPYERPDYSTMSTRNIGNERGNILERIDTEFASLNDQFKDNSKALDVNTIENHFKDLKEINRTLERRKEDATHPRRCFDVGNASTVTWITFGAEVFAGVLVCGATVGNYILNNKASDEIAEFEAQYNTTIDSSTLDTMQGINVAALITTVIAMGILVPLVSGVRQIDNDNDHFEVLMRLSAIKEDSKELRRFIKQFKQFQDSIDPSSPRDPKDAMGVCVRTLDSVPSGNFNEHIPDRDHWISAMVRLLPEDHPIKIQLREMHTAQLQESEEYDDARTSSDSPSSNSSNSLFQGEKMAKSPFGNHALHINSGSDEAFVETEKFATPRNLLDEHSMRWYALEKTLGFGVDRIQFNNIAFSRDGRIANDILELGAKPLFSRDLSDKEADNSYL